MFVQALDRLNVGLKAQWTPMTFSKQLRSVEIEFIDTLLEQKDTTTVSRPHTVAVPLEEPAANIHQKRS